MTTTFRFYFTEIPLLVHCSLVSFNIFTPYNAMAPKENGFSQIVAIFLYYLYYYEFLLFSDGVWIKSTSFERAPSIFPIKCIPLTDTIYIDIQIIMLIIILSPPLEVLTHTHRTVCKDQFGKYFLYTIYTPVFDVVTRKHVFPSICSIGMKNIGEHFCYFSMMDTKLNKPQAIKTLSEIYFGFYYQVYIIEMKNHQFFHLCHFHFLFVYIFTSFMLFVYRHFLF